MKEKEPFPEILVYLKQLQHDFNIEVTEYANTTKINHNFMKESINDFIQRNSIDVIISGTRSTDPYSQGLNLSQTSDVHLGWPEFTRLNPINFWDYNLVWRFILENNLPYCSLYLKGYTYVGDQINSIVNPFIKNQHAAMGNDNIELFSRSRLYEALPRNNGKISFNENGCFIIVTKCANEVEKLSETDLAVIEKGVRNFCNEWSFTFDSDISQINLIQNKNSNSTANELFIEEILNRKRKPGNFTNLYLGIVYDFEKKTLDVFI